MVVCRVKNYLTNIIIPYNHEIARRKILQDVYKRQVPDERLQPLTDLYHAKKTTPAVVEFVDIAGLVRGASKGEGLSLIHI